MTAGTNDSEARPRATSIQRTRMQLSAYAQVRVY